MQAFLDFINHCDWCGEYLPIDDLIEYEDENGTFYFCKECMEKIKRAEKSNAEV